MASGFPTLRDYKAGNQGRIYAWCGNNLCQHGERLDLDKLIALLGPDFEVSAASMNRRLRCSKCGARNCRINLPGDQRSELAKDRARAEAADGNKKAPPVSRRG